MKNRSYVVGWLFLALASFSWGQSPNCNTSTNWCGSVHPGWALHNLATPRSTPRHPAQEPEHLGHDGQRYPFLPRTPGADVVPNGGIGVDQYLEAASKYFAGVRQDHGRTDLFRQRPGLPRRPSSLTQSGNRIWGGQVWADTGGHNRRPRPGQLGVGPFHHKQHFEPRAKHR